MATFQIEIEDKYLAGLMHFLPTDGEATDLTSFVTRQIKTLAQQGLNQLAIDHANSIVKAIQSGDQEQITTAIATAQNELSLAVNNDLTTIQSL